MLDRSGVLLGWPKTCPTCGDDNICLAPPPDASKINKYVIQFKCMSCYYHWHDICYFDDKDITVFLIVIEGTRPLILPIQTAQTDDTDVKIKEAKEGIDALIRNNKFENIVASEDGTYPKILLIVPVSELVIDLPLLIVEPGTNYKQSSLILPNEGKAACSKTVLHPINKNI